MSDSAWRQTSTERSTNFWQNGSWVAVTSYSLTSLRKERSVPSRSTGVRRQTCDRSAGRPAERCCSSSTAFWRATRSSWRASSWRCSAGVRCICARVSRSFSLGSTAPPAPMARISHPIDIAPAFTRAMRAVRQRQQAAEIEYGELLQMMYLWESRRSSPRTNQLSHRRFRHLNTHGSARRRGIHLTLTMWTQFF